MPGLQVLACFWLGTQLSCTHSIIAFSGCISARIELRNPVRPVCSVTRRAVPLCNLLPQSTQ